MAGWIGCCSLHGNQNPLQVVILTEWSMAMSCHRHLWVCQQSRPLLPKDETNQCLACSVCVRACHSASCKPADSRQILYFTCDAAFCLLIDNEHYLSHLSIIWPCCVLSTLKSSPSAAAAVTKPLSRYYSISSREKFQISFHTPDYDHNQTVIDPEQPPEYDYEVTKDPTDWSYVEWYLPRIRIPDPPREITTDSPSPSGWLPQDGGYNKQTPDVSKQQ